MTDTGAPRDWTQGGEAVTYQRCDGCGAVWYFLRGFCPRCGNARPATLLARGRGTVYARTLVYRAPSESLRSHVPYLIALVDMEEGFRMMGHGDAELAIGDPVQAGFAQFGETLVPRFHKRKE
jgi:uncharacterized OB-fold protein